MSQAARGEMYEGQYYFPLRVYYEDTDAGGIVYHASYIRYAERARTEMLRTLGFNQRVLREEEGILFIVRTLTAQYLAPARLDDELVVINSLERFGRSSFVLKQRICFDSETRKVQHTLKNCVDLDVVLVCINQQGKPVRVPDDIRKKIEDHLAAANAA